MADALNKTQAAVEGSLAKAREAQQKFEEAKAKFEAVQAKAQAAAEKARAAQQKIKEAEAAFKEVGGLSGGGISAVVAVLVGTLRAQLILRIQKEVIKMLTKFLNQCPKQSELQRIIKVRNNLIKNINSFQKRVDGLSGIAQGLLALANIIKLLIKGIKLLAIPTVVVPPQAPVGAVGVGVNLIVKYADALETLNKRLDKIIAEAAAITSLIASVSAMIKSLKQRLDSVDAQIQACIDNPSEVLVQASIAEAAKPSEEGVYYKGYKLEIVQDIVEYKLAPKRHAIAIDKRGIVVLQGPSSFSSSTQVLLDELKFRIDQLL